MTDVTSFLTATAQVQEVTPATPLPVADAAVLAAVEATTAAVEAAASSPVNATITPPENIATGQASVTATEAVIVPARPGRVSVSLIQETATDVRFGTQGVTLATGAKLKGVDGASVTIQGGAAIYGITAAGTTAHVSFIEVF